MPAPADTTAPITPDDRRLRRWERRSDKPLAAAAVVFLASYSWLVLDPDLARPWARALTIVDYVTWAAFVVDYVARVRLSPQRGRFVLRHLPELAMVALPVLRPLRLLRLIALMRVLNLSAERALRGRVGVYTLITSVLVVYAGSLAVLGAERGHPGANIETFGTSLWWTMTTVTTVGYGDHYPVTTQGRFVAAALMLAGIALIGTVTASIASYLVERVRGSSADVSASDEIRALRTELAEVRSLLIAGQASSNGESRP